MLSLITRATHEALFPLSKFTNIFKRHNAVKIVTIHRTHFPMKRVKVRITSVAIEACFACKADKGLFIQIVLHPETALIPSSSVTALSSVYTAFLVPLHLLLKCSTVQLLSGLLSLSLSFSFFCVHRSYMKDFLDTSPLSSV